MAGFGPVVTGSLVSGTRFARAEARAPAGAAARSACAASRCTGDETPEARAGERVSANLAGVELSDLRRGSTLAGTGRVRRDAVCDRARELLAVGAAR